MSYTDDIGDVDRQQNIINQKDHECEKSNDEISYILIKENNQLISKFAKCSLCKKTVRLN